MNTYLSTLIENIERGHGTGLIAGEPADLRRVTWPEVHEQARVVAGALWSAGVRPSDAVAILAAMPADVAPTVQGVLLAGATVTMMHQPTPRTDLDAWIAETARAVAVIGARVLVVGAPFEYALPRLAGAAVTCLTVADLRAGTAIEPVATSDEDVAFLQLTSGSTGHPKAVSISYRNLAANLRGMEFAAQVTLRDVLVSWLPLSHDMGMMGFLMAPMAYGNDLVSVTPTDFVKSPLLWAKLVTTYRATMSAAPNFAYKLLARRMARAADGDYDLSSLRFMLNGAEQVDAEVLEKFIEQGARFGLRRESIVPAYGMAEATLAVSFVRPGAGHRVEAVDADTLQRDGRAVPAVAGGVGVRHVRLGRVLPGIQARVVTEGGEVGQRRQVGEIQIRGDSVSRGYRAETGFVSAVDADGWLSTGDIGYETEDAQWVVCGRKKDMLIVAGRNIYPADIERSATAVEGVREGNAIAVRLMTPQTAESFAVIVESAAHRDADKSDRIRRDVAHRVYQDIGVTARDVVVVPAGWIPKTPSGKPRRTDAAVLATDLLREPA